MRVVHSVASIDNAAAGPSYSVPALAAAQAEHGAEVDLLSIGAPGREQMGRLRIRRFRNDFGRVPVLRGLGLSLGFSRDIVSAGRTSDVIHTHGLWLAANIVPGLAVRAPRAKARFVIAPRGMLGDAALKFSPGKKKAMWFLAQGDAARRADCWHATAMSEYDDIRAMGLRQPVAVVPNGIDIPGEIKAATPKDGTRTIISLGRVHPKKGLSRLVEAWASLEAEHPDWRLEIIGPAELNHDEELRALAARLGLSRVSVIGPVFGEAKLATMAGADLFVLPTLHENFAMTVAESLAAGTPVICTKGAPWAGLDAERCGWWIDHGAEPMAAALRRAMAAPPEELAAMGARGRDWMVRDFGWSRIASDMLDVYRWLAEGGEAPPAIRFD